MRLLIVSFLIFLISCENKKETTSTSDTDTSISKPPLTDGDVITQPTDSLPAPETPIQSECYLQTSGRDSTWLRLARHGNSLMGDMLFDNYQIDGSHGTVKGSINGNIIELWYNAEAEGMRFHRQLFFKEEGDQLLWGKGIQVVRNDSTFFKDTVKTTYSAHLFLRKTTCTDKWH